MSNQTDKKAAVVPTEEKKEEKKAAVVTTAEEDKKKKKTGGSKSKTKLHKELEGLLWDREIRALFKKTYKKHLKKKESPVQKRKPSKYALFVKAFSQENKGIPDLFKKAAQAYKESKAAETAT